MNSFKDNIPEPFTGPATVPDSEAERHMLQEANRSFWEKHPMRYDWKERVAYPEFSRKFFEEIDRRFFEDSREYAPWREVPFERFIDFAALPHMDVLEIGVGNGSHAGLLAARAKSFTGIDLTGYSVRAVTERFKVFGLRGKILQMDAERLEFPDASFDFVWSWGVIHHSSNTPRILREIRRVLRPGGTAAIMVYHRGWWNYYVVGFLRGIVSGTLLQTRSLHTSIQLQTDGAIARYYSKRDWRALAQSIGFGCRQTGIFGPKSDVLPLPASAFKNVLRRVLPDFFSRFLTHTLSMGGFLVSELSTPLR